MDHCVDILEGCQLAQQLLPGNPRVSTDRQQTQTIINL
jgi:hypothetical protein